MAAKRRKSAKGKGTDPYLRLIEIGIAENEPQPNRASFQWREISAGGPANLAVNPVTVDLDTFGQRET